MQLRAATVSRFALAACTVASLWYIGAFFYIAFSSINYPFALEWIEGQTVDVVARIVAGKPVYVEPHLDYVPFIYTPLYYYITALVSLLTGVDFFAGRAVSIVATAGVAMLIHAFVRKEGGSFQSGVIAAGIFFSTYALSGRWFDIARIDSLFMLLTLAGLYVLLYFDTLRSALLAAFLLALAFYTKQFALVIAAPVLVYKWLDAKKNAFVCAGALLLLLLLLIAVSDLVSAGWFSFYVFEVPAGHSFRHNGFYNYLRNDLWDEFPIYLGIVLFFIAACLRFERRHALRYALFLSGFFCASASARMHEAGWINTLIPVHAGGAITIGYALNRLQAHKNKILLPAFCALILCQMYMLKFDIRSMIPQPYALAANSRFLDVIKTYEGEVFMPDIQFSSGYVGKRSYAFGMPAEDILRANLNSKNAVKENLRAELINALKSQQFSAMVIPLHLGRLKPRGIVEIDKYYTLDKHTEYLYGYALDSQGVKRLDIYVPKPAGQQPLR